MSCDRCGAACQGSRCSQCVALAAGKAMFEAAAAADETDDETEPDRPENSHDITAWSDDDE